MYARTRATRLTIALLPAILLGSLLSTSQLLGQNDGPLFPELDPTSEAVLPSAVVSVLGDGFVGAPTVAPVSGACRTSQNGPVEQAAARVTETVVIVDNLSCAGISMDDVVRDQVPNMRPDTDVVIVGGLGLEFDWPALAESCLQPTTRSITGCRSEAGLARADAANAFLQWRSLIDQSRRIAPDAMIVIVAPPLPVGVEPHVLGRDCCGETVDVNEQVRSVFDTASSLRQVVVEADDQPILLVETDVTFDQHRLDDSDPWLRTAGEFLGTPVAAGVAAMADRLEAVMPVGAIPGATANESQVALVVGSTTSDGDDLAALAAASSGWFEEFAQAHVEPSVFLVPVEVTPVQPEPEPDPDTGTPEIPALPEEGDQPGDGGQPGDDEEGEAPQDPGPAEDAEQPEEEPEEEEADADAEETPDESADSDLPPEVDADADEIDGDEIEVEEFERELLEPAADEPLLDRGLQNEAEEEVEVEIGVGEVIEIDDPVEPEGDNPVEPEGDNPVEAPVPSFVQAETADGLIDGIDSIERTDGITALADVAAAIVEADAVLSGPAADRSIVVRVPSMKAPAEPDGSFAELLTQIEGEIDIIANDVEDATVWSEIVEGSNVLVSVASTEELAGALPAPDPVLEINDLTVPTRVELLMDQTTQVGIGIETIQPVDAEVTWWLDGELIAVGQRTLIDTARLGLGDHLVDVRVETDVQELLALTRFIVTNDGDGFADDLACPNTFDEDVNDLDGDGQTTSCDDDDDGDGLVDVLDPCPLTFNTNLADADLDRLPDACDNEQRDGPGADSDGDGFSDLIDNCPMVAFATQFDADADGIGNACELGTLDPLCTITGTTGDDVLRGTAGDDVICALDGDDIVIGSGGHDTIFGGAGDDWLTGGADTDRIFGGAGHDTIEGNGSPDLILGEGGNDSIEGGVGQDTISGGIGADTIEGNDGDDFIFGGDGADLLHGGDGADTIDGGAGHDVIYGEFGNDYLVGGAGTDTVGGGQHNDIIVGVGENDFVRGGGGTDIIDDDPIRVT